jgi:hypothetical protein
MDCGLTILEFDAYGSDYVHVRVAIDGHLVIPFDVPKSVYVDDFPRAEDFEAYLERQARSLLAAYGDAREGRQEPLSEFVA